MSQRMLRMVPRLNFKLGDCHFKGGKGSGTSVNVVMSKGSKKLAAIIFDRPEVIGGNTTLMNYQIGTTRSGAESVDISDADINDEKQLIAFIEGIVLAWRSVGVLKEE